MPPLPDFFAKSFNRRTKNTLYMLKRQYGGTINIYKMGDAVTDHLTGVRTVPLDVTVVRRAVVLPIKTVRESAQTISIISANKSFVTGGNYDTGLRMFIVEQTDAPSITELTESDWVVYKNKKYEIKSFEEYESGTGWVIIGKNIFGEPFNQVFPMYADNLLQLTHSGDIVP